MNPSPAVTSTPVQVMDTKALKSDDLIHYVHSSVLSSNLIVTVDCCSVLQWPNTDAAANGNLHNGPPFIKVLQIQLCKASLRQSPCEIQEASASGQSQCTLIRAL